MNFKIIFWCNSKYITFLICYLICWSCLNHFFKFLSWSRPLIVLFYFIFSPFFLSLTLYIGKFLLSVGGVMVCPLQDIFSPWSEWDSNSWENSWLNSCQFVSTFANFFWHYVHLGLTWLWYLQKQLFCQYFRSENKVHSFIVRFSWFIKFNGVTCMQRELHGIVILKMWQTVLVPKTLS